MSLSQGILWIAFQKYGTMLLTLVSNIILARMLSPSDFGVLGVLMTFIAFSDIFIEGGLTSSLIQKGNPTKDDFSSVFFFNVVVSIAFFIILLLSAPYISKFFNTEQITETLRAIGVVLIINAVSIIPLVQLQIHLKFKNLSLYNLTGNFIGVLFGITLAFSGFGVWSLVIKTITTQLTIAVIIWAKSSWRPSFHFSTANIKSLYNFGGFIFLSTFIEFLYSYLQPILIGKMFSMSSLGYFSQARRIEEIPANSMVSIVNTVTFPIYSKLKSDYKQLIANASKSLCCLSYINFPIMFFLILGSKNIILILFGEKWLPSYPLLQILCIAGMFRVPSGNNMNIIKSIGKSKSFLFVQLFKRILGIVCILLGFQWGLIGLMWGFAVSGILFFIIDSLVCGYYIGYGIQRQCSDMVSSFVLSILACAITSLIGVLLNPMHPIFVIIIQSLTFTTVYLLFSFFLKVRAYQYYSDKLAAFLGKSRNL